MKSVVSSKGQITLPAELRKQLGLAAGTPIEFEVRGGGAFIREGTGAVHPVDRVFGCLRLPAPVDDLMETTRGPRAQTEKVSARRRRKRARSD